MQQTRLDKFLSEANAVSRADARKLIQKGMVTVNGCTVKVIDQKVQQNDLVCFNGKSLNVKKNVYIMLNKPRGIVSASRDKNDKTVVDLVSTAFPRRNLFPAGRLDKESHGFVLITDDGNFAHNILAPTKHVSKTYLVKVDTALTQNLCHEFENGVTLADGSKMNSATLQIIQPDTALIVLKQGVYHQIKRMLGVYGIGVNDLKRIAIGALPLDESLAEGEWREITLQELQKITQ